MGRRSRLETEHTPIGEWLLKYSKDHKISMRQMAKELNMTVAYLSGVGTGVNNIPTYLNDALNTKFTLSNIEKQDLVKAIDSTPESTKVKRADRVCISIYHPNDNIRLLVYNFAQKVKGLSKDQVHKINLILENSSK